MVVLEIDDRYPDGSDLDRTWRARRPLPDDGRIPDARAVDRSLG